MRNIKQLFFGLGGKRIGIRLNKSETKRKEMKRKKKTKRDSFVIYARETMLM